MNQKKILIRTIENKIVKWYKDNNKKPLLLNGMRQVGKTTTINIFLEKYSKNNYIKLNLIEERDKEVFDDSGSFDEIMTNIEAISGKKINKDTIIFIDEVQESEKAYNFIKIANDNPSYNNNLILSGSYINRYVLKNEYKVALGSYQELIMYPLTFYEYVLNKGWDSKLKHVESAIKKEEKVLTQIHNDLLSALDEYILIGGMPAIVLTFLETGNIEVVESLLLNLQEQQKDDIQRGLTKPSKTKIIQIYNSIKNTISRTEGLKVPKLMFSDIDKKSKARYSKYKYELDILLRNNVLTPVYQINNPNIDIVNDKRIKLLYSDMGYLSRSIGFNNVNNAIKEKEQILGYITENFVALELQSYYWPDELKYWYKSKMKTSSITTNSNEIDFLFKSLPIDVKSGNNAQTSSSLKAYFKLYNPKYSIIISRNNFSINHNTKRIKLPLYSVWMLKKIIDK